MKTRSIFLSITIIAALFIFQGCEETPQIEEQPGYGILPEKFKVDIPDNLTSTNLKSTKGLKSASAEPMSGNEIYEYMTFFIAIGEEAANIVEEIIWSIVVHKIDRVKEVVYESDDDNRIKKLIVTEQVEYSNITWEYGMTIHDVESESNPDGGKALQVFWNKSPREGIAVIKPYNINRKNDSEMGDAIFRITYSEEEANGYEAHMLVEMADMPLADPAKDPFSVQSMKMFVGKKGDMIDVYGNSGHPNAKFHSKRIGFNWAFVASGFETEDMSVAEVGLPAWDLDTDSRDILLKDNSIKNFMTEEINAYFFDLYGLHPDQDELAKMLVNADAPGYFDKDGFVQSGTAPDAKYDVLTTSIKGLSPYNPKKIKELEILFK